MHGWIALLVTVRLSGGGEIALGGEAVRFVPAVPAILSIDRRISLTSSLVNVGSGTAALGVDVRRRRATSRVTWSILLR